MCLYEQHLIPYGHALCPAHRHRQPVCDMTYEGARAITGPLFGFSDTWQLIINTPTTIVTFLMVFIIQHTQDRDTDALQVKLGGLRVSHELPQYPV
jgi:hypothetical protein